MSEEQAPEAPPAKKKGGWLMKALVVGVVLGAAGGGAWWMMRGDGAAAAEPAEPGPETRGLLVFEPFLVNLADGGGSRFLKLNLQLVVATKEDEKEIAETPVLLGKLRSAFLELLSEQTATDLVTAEGKVKLKARIKEHANALIHEKVIDVLFAEFVVQF